MRNMVRIVFIAAFIVGCCNSMTVSGKKVTFEPVDSNDAKAIRIVNELFDLPYQSMDLPETDDTFTAKDIDSVRQAASSLRSLAGIGTMRYLFDILEVGFDKEAFVRWDFVNGPESTRARWILESFKPSDSFVQELGNRVKNAREPAYKWLLVKMASRSLPADEGLRIVGSEITDTTIFKPKIIKKGSDLEFEPRNRICDQVFLELVWQLDLGAFRKLSIQWLPDDRYEEVLKGFVRWWNSNEDRLLAEGARIDDKYYHKDRYVSDEEISIHMKEYKSWVGLPRFLFDGGLTAEDLAKKSRVLDEWAKKYADTPIDKIPEPDLGLHVAAQPAPHEGESDSK